MDNKEKPKPGVIATLFEGIVQVWSEMFGAVMEVLPKWISLFFWILLAIPTLLCVLVANAWFPTWIKWGEKF